LLALKHSARDTFFRGKVTLPDASFSMLGSNVALPLDKQIAAGDVVAVYNLGITGADAYLGDNTTRIIAATEATAATGGAAVSAETGITIVPKLFPLASASSRFQVIPAAENVVAYVCRDGNLYRTASVTFSSNCPSTGPLLASHVSACLFDYSGTDQQRNALVRLAIAFTDTAETVHLIDEVHVNNTP